MMYQVKKLEGWLDSVHYFIRDNPETKKLFLKRIKELVESVEDNAIRQERFSEDWDKSPGYVV